MINKMIIRMTILKGMTLMLLFSLQSGGYAQDSDSIFRMANEAYRKGDYRVAGELYASLASAGVKSAEIFYNLGNCSFKQRKVAEAVLWYERALQIRPMDRNIRYNLSLANGFVKDEIKEAEILFLEKWWQGAASAFPASTWLWLHVSAFFTCLLLTAWFLITRRHNRKKWGFRGAVLFLSISLILLAFGLQRHFTEREKNAIIMTEKVTVKSGPANHTTSLGDYHAGTRVMVLSEADGWFEIQTSDGHIGWLPANDLEVI